LIDLIFTGQTAIITTISNSVFAVFGNQSANRNIPTLSSTEHHSNEQDIEET
jgi:hypothetical protein